MKSWNSKALPAQEALAHADKCLEIARNTQHERRAWKLCKDAKSALEKIDVPVNIIFVDQIIAAYHENGRVLKVLGRDKEANISYKKADELREKYFQGAVALPAASSANQSTISASASNTILSQKLELIPASVFAKDFGLHAFDGKLPKPDRRLDDTRQLAYCLGLLLQDSAEFDDTQDAETRAWLQATRGNTDEQERLKALAKDLLREFAREELKDATAVAEVILLAPVLEKQYFRLLLERFVNNFGTSILLNTPALDGLDYVVQSAPQGSIDADDLVKILKHLDSRIEDTHSDSLDYIYRLTSVVSHILDNMVLDNVQRLNRVSLHTPLKVYLQKLLKSADPYLRYQAAYASQALLWVSNDEELWKAAIRRAGTVAMGVGRLVTAAKALNIVEFIDGLSNIQDGMEGTGQLFKLVADAYKAATELMKGGQGFQGLLKEGLGFSRRQKWYPLLRATDTLLRNGELFKFKSLVCNAPLTCRLDAAFQWGVCQRLGYVAADPHWDLDARQDAIAFLGEIYRNDAAWGRQVQVKKCILKTLMQLTFESGEVKKTAESLLHDLQSDGDATKLAHYEACQKERPSIRPWKAVLPLLESSPLLDRAQNKPDVRPCVQRFRRKRLEDRGKEVYIPPEAKAGRQAPDESRFPLMENVKDFLSGDQEVLLILGESGSGKSTFNQELEWELWDAYGKDKDRIPIFVWLPEIDRPEIDIIAQRLKDSDFNEEQIRELKDYYKFVLICDGYDERQLACNLYNANRLNETGQWQAKMVISCRSEHIGPSYQSLFQPNDSNGRKGATLLREVVILPFSIDKIQDYVQQYVDKYASMKESPWEVGNYIRAIKDIPGLQELVSNPLLLKLSLEVLPDIVGQKDLSSVKVTRVALYDKHVENWAKERGEKRQADNGNLKGTKKKAFQDLHQDDFVQGAIGFMTRLAVAIFEQQDGKAIVTYPPKNLTWKDGFFGRDDKIPILGAASPIIRIDNGNKYKFKHLSFQDYGLARAVFEPRLGDGEDEGESGVRTIKAAGMSYGRTSIKLASDSPSPLFWRSYVKNPSIMQFLVERIQQEPIFEKELLAFIEQSKMDAKWNIAAANAITILVKAGKHFNEEDLTGIHFTGADLSGSQFDSAQFEGTDLRRVNLRNIWLRQVNLSNARMKDVELGERPHLKEDGTACFCVYSPDGRACLRNSMHDRLAVSNTSLQGVQGLSEMNLRLLPQRDQGVVDPGFSDSAENEPSESEANQSLDLEAYEPWDPETYESYDPDPDPEEYESYDPEPDVEEYDSYDPEPDAEEYESWDPEPDPEEYESWY